MVKFKHILQENKNPIQIFCDMDSVLTDFPLAFQRVSGKYVVGFESKYGTARFWDEVEKGGLEFWSKMPWMPDGKVLWSGLLKLPYPIQILTAPAKKRYGIVHDYSVNGKKIWVHDNLSQFVPIIFKQGIYKSDYATESAILIDDMQANISAWESKGGIGILHKNAVDTLDKIKVALQKLESQK